MEQLSKENIIIIAVVLAVFLLVITYLISSKRGSRKKISDSSDYIRALNAYIEGELEDAVQFFHLSVNQNTDNIDAYIRLGDIFREQGKLEKSIKIHRGLLIRRNLTQATKNQIHRSLAKDLVKAKSYDKALETIQQVLAKEPTKMWAKKQELEIYEAKQDWANAFKTLKQLNKWEKIPELNAKLALYKVEMALSHIDKSKEKDGRILLREAIKLDASCAPGYIYLGDSYVRETRYADAIKTWVDFVRQVPSKAQLVLDRLQEVLYTTGSYSEIENILIELYEKAPENIEVSTMLSDVKERKGDINGAIRQCEAVIDLDPGSQNAKLRLVRLYAKDNKSDLALQTALELANQNSKSEKKYYCSICNFETEKPLWHCPECKNWNSFNV